MTDDYKQQIVAHARETIQHRIATLKQQHPDRLYTRQWSLRWPDGFQQGNNVIPVLTTTKEGPYCIGELHLVVPASFELDLEAMEFVPKNAPVREHNTRDRSSPSLDTSLTMLNAMVEALNGFLTGGEHHTHTMTPLSTDQSFLDNSGAPDRYSRNPVILQNGPGDRIESVRRAILEHEELPEWFVTISDTTVRDALLQKMAETYLQYRTQRSGHVSLGEFFKEYTEYLSDRDMLRHWCAYKSKPVELNDRGWCQETYCSKKPYQAVCPRATRKFMPTEND